MRFFSYTGTIDSGYRGCFRAYLTSYAIQLLYHGFFRTWLLPPMVDGLTVFVSG